MTEEHGASTGRDRLARASVLVVGVGALGSAAALRLAESGVGRLVLVDHDRVELSNLHRQILHGTASLGAAKVESAQRALRAEHPAVDIEARAERLEPDNLASFFARADFVIDATDGVAAKFLLNDGAVRLGTPYSHAGVLGFRGQTLTVWPGRSACYRCLFPQVPDADEVPSCREAGILGGVAGVIGSVQAGEAIRFLLGLRPALLDCLATWDALRGRWRRVTFGRDPECPACGGRPTIERLDAARPARYGS